MSTITLPNIRVSSDLTIRLKLKDGGVAIDWSTLQNIRVSLYADDQRSMASRCSVSIDEEDSTILVCQYAANKMQYLGVNRVIVQCKYMGEVKTYDKPAFNFVRWTSDQEGEQITIDDPDVDVEISVEDVSSSILQEAVDAAFDAADRANDAAAAAEHMVDIHTGPEGKSAYEVAVEEGYTGTEEEWLASLKGPVGETPDISIGTVTTVEPGTPAAASMTGTPEAPVLNLSIPKGLVGATPNFTVGTVTTGEPGSSVIVTITGTPEAPVLNLTIPQGMQGNTGSSVDYPYELVNNLTTNDATKGLSAAQGVVLDGKVSQLEAKVDDISTGKYYGYYATSADLPDDATVDGFAYVGSGPTYTIYNCEGGVWTSSGITVNQSPVGNEEDIDQNSDGKLQFANRTYNSLQPDGMGYKILRKDATFASQVTDTNTVYEIRYNFDLGGNTVNLPANCILRFNGGCLSNGILNGNNTSINEDVTYKIFDNVTPKNFTFSFFDIRWVGAIPEVNTDSAPYFQKAMDMCEFYQSLPIRVIGKYTISSTVVCRNHFQLFGNNFVARAFSEALPAYKTSIISVAANTIAFLVSGIQTTGGITYCSFNVHNILFTGAERASTTLFKITTTGAPSRPCVLNQCEMLNFNKVFDIAILNNGNGTMISQWTINENNIAGNNSFISTETTAEATLLNMSIYDNIIEQHNLDAITLYNPAGYIKFENNLIESNVGYAISVPSTTKQCHFEVVGNYLEGTKPFLSIINDNTTNSNYKVTLNCRDNYFYQGLVSTYRFVLQNVIVDAIDDGQYMDSTSSFNGCYFSKTANTARIPISCLGEFNAFEELPEFDCGEFITTPFRHSGLSIHNVVNGRIVNRKDAFGSGSFPTYGFTPVTGTAEGDSAVAMFYCGLSGLMNIDFNYGVSNNKNYGFPKPGFAVIKRAYPSSGNNNISVTAYISTTNQYAYYSVCVTIVQLKSHPEVSNVGDLSVGKNMIVDVSVPLPSAENSGLVATVASSKKVMWMGTAWKNLDGTALS